MMNIGATRSTSCRAFATHPGSATHAGRQTDARPHRTPLTEWHCSQYTSWAFGQRIRAAGLLGSMGSVGDCYDNAMMESFWGTMQMELLDSRTWETRD